MMLLWVDAILFVIASGFILLYKYVGGKNSLQNNSITHKTKRVKTNGFEINNTKLEPDQPVPRSVNYHFTRKCNYECGFCFHTAKTSFMLELADAKRGLEMLKIAGKL